MFFYVVNDPGIPLGESEDPIAGLGRELGRALLAGRETDDGEEDEPEEDGWSGYPFAWRGFAEAPTGGARTGIRHGRVPTAGLPGHPGHKTTPYPSEIGLSGVPPGETPGSNPGLPVHPGHRRTSWAHESIEEGKSISSAGFGGDVLARDVVARTQARGTIRKHIRQASRNANRDLQEVYETVEETIGGLLADWIEGRITISKLRAESADWWSRAYLRAREVGRKASAIERLHPQPEILSEEEAWFRSAVREELRYWNLFLQEMLRDRRARRFDEGRMWERFGNYVKAIRFMYEASRVQALPDNLLFYWMGPKPVPSQKGRICKGCEFLVENSPYTKDTLPAVPRDGSTACLTNCRHRLVVRVADRIDIERRRRVLESRTVLSRRLKRLKERAHGTWRQRRAREIAQAVAPHVANPFLGQRLPTNPGMFRGVPRPDERRGLTEAELLGPVPLARRLTRITEAVRSDMPMRHLDLYFAARQLEAQIRRNPDRRTIQPILDRFVGALEATVLASQGRSEAQRFESAMRSAIGRLWAVVDAAGLSESDSGLVLGAAAGAI